MKSDKTYIMQLRCRNCGIDTTPKIPLGVSRQEFAHGKKCDNCGCRIDGSDSLLRNKQYNEKIGG